jgi:deoxyribodipyrimidine photolyase-related protein
LLLVLGDQLDEKMPALSQLDRERDVVLMAEVREEAEHVPSHRQRTTLFLSAMRHYALELLNSGYRVYYVRLDDRANTQSLGSEVVRAVERLKPECIQVVQPGDHRVAAMLEAALAGQDTPLQFLDDASFTCSLDEFRAWADDGRKELIMEFFYRQRRRALDILVDKKGRPEGGAWNFDKSNRQAFKQAPEIPRPYQPRPDDVTREVMQLVERTWPQSPGRMEKFHWPVTRREALRALRDFVKNRLFNFGTYEDAMWSGEPVLFHSRLSSSLNIKLLHPQECLDLAVEAYQNGQVPINDAEGFVRQIIGWREFIRGVYFREGPRYAHRNGLEHRGALPVFYWTGETDMNCLKHCICEVLDNAWGHHIPRLMVLGNFALIAGVQPSAINDWFLAMYVDSVDWVTTPNVIGMSQCADHGVVGTKPYACSGKYINRMSNYCGDCRYDLTRRTGDNACPFNTLYWDFMVRHRKRFEGNRRMVMALKNVDRVDATEKKLIRKRASRLRAKFSVSDA